MNARMSMNVMCFVCINVLPVHEVAGADSQYMDASGQTCPQSYPLYMGTRSALLGLNAPTTHRLA